MAIMPSISLLSIRETHQWAREVNILRVNDRKVGPVESILMTKVGKRMISLSDRLRPHIGPLVSQYIDCIVFKMEHGC